MDLHPLSAAELMWESWVCLRARFAFHLQQTPSLCFDVRRTPYRRLPSQRPRYIQNRGAIGDCAAVHRPIAAQNCKRRGG